MPPQHLTTPQIGVAVWGVASALTCLWGLVQLVRGVLDDGIGLSVGGFLFAAASLLVYLRLRRRGSPELHVGPAGLAVVSAGTRREWRWDDLHDVYVVGGVDRLLAVEDHAAARAQDQTPRSTGVLRSAGLASPHAVTVALRGRQPGEQAVVQAIAAASGGRFPSPERGPRLPGR